MNDFNVLLVGVLCVVIGRGGSGWLFSVCVLVMCGWLVVYMFMCGRVLRWLLKVLGLRYSFCGVSSGCFIL